MPIMKAGEGPASRSHFHRSFPNSFHAQTEDVRTQSEDVLAAMNALCRSSALLAETFMGVFQDTPFMELALRLKQVSQDLAARTLNASEHIQEDGIAMVARLIGRGTKEKTDEGVQVLARCFLLMLQTQCHFFRSATDVFAPLGRYEEVEDVLIGERCEDDGIREACSTWIAASQATKSLRTGVSLTPNEQQLLDDAHHPRGHHGDAKVSEVKQKLDIQSSVYKQALSELPRSEHTLTGGFHLQQQCTSLLLHGCCSIAEATELLDSQSNNKLLHHAMPGERSHQPQQQQRLSAEELRAVLQTDLRDVSLQVEGSPCHTSQNQEENFKSKLQAVEKLVKETSKQLGVGVNREQVALALLCEACPSVAENQSRLAAQFIFGRADVVRIKPSNLHGNLQKYAQISSQEGAFTVEVPTVWKLDQTFRTKSAAGLETSLGVVEVVYVRRIELLEGRHPPLPTIKVKLRQVERTSPTTPTPQGSLRSPGDGSLGSPLGKGFRHTMEKLAAKFGLGSAPVPKAASSEFYVSVDAVPDQQAELTNHNSNGSSNSQSKVKEEPHLAQHKGPVSCSTPKREVAKDTVPSVMPRPAMISPTVTITSHPSPTEEQVSWNKNVVGYKGPVKTPKKGFASDAEVQDIVDLLSGVTRPPQTVIGQHLDTFGQSQRSTQNTTPSSSSSSGSNRSAVGGTWPGGGGGGGMDPNPAKFGNFNPTFQEAEAQDRVGEIPLTTHNIVAVSRAWSNPVPCQTGPQQHPVQPLHRHESYGNHDAERDIVSMYDNSSTDEEFAKYIATNFLGKRTKGYAKDLNMVGDQWGYPDSRLNQTWPPPPEGTSDSGAEHLSHSFSGQHDSGSSSDESGENGDTAFSMGLGLTGPNFVASVNRRRHSSGGEEVIHHGRSFDPTGQAAMKYLEVAQMEPKSTKTWPPKVLWQRPVSPNDGATPTPGPYPLPPQEQLLVHPPLTPQWSDPVTLRQPPMWPPTGGSTPVSPAGSMSRLAPMQQPVQQGVPGGSAVGGMGGVQGGAGMARAHPKLDRKYAYSQY
ncbi:granule associated Rac and RHOG effector protein 1-like [Patiria miniata]|uniref:Uncharacterized protein n=1 Tax=Patiria miniata TaxID=46514 RepID=A0A914B2X3_PATMI|nr:granule associated Rac and RHOG effector protein 1-like [Patiria miniata]XP_038070155.1 granule associated Rac and RHOG effector protein 1-like [Patiria miniata]